MTERSLRRAAERQAAKQSRKESRRNGTAATVSPAQFTANRANAQLAHGAATPAGKAISSRNHTSHGLTAIPTENFKVLSNENQAAYDQSLTDYRHEWKPTTASEHDLVNRLATHAWLRDRAIRLQNQILEEIGEEMAVDQRKDFGLYLRYYNTHARAYGKAFSEIMRLRNFQMRQQTQAATLQIRFESHTQKTELHAAKIEVVHLRQTAIKQRNQRTQTPAIVQTHPPVALALFQSCDQ